MHFVLDFNKKILINKTTNIPRLYKLDRSKFTISVDSHEVSTIKTCMKQNEGQIIIPEMNVNQMFSWDWT